MKVFNRLFCFSIIFMLGIAMNAQSSRAYVKSNIEKWGSCRNVAITDKGGDIALNYTNQYAFDGIPSGLANAIKRLHDKSEFIDDIQLTEGASWLVLYGDNGCEWYGIPSSLETAIRDFNNKGEVITSITFNDEGDWIIISTEHVQASDQSIQDYLSEGINQYGSLWAAHLTNDGCVLCYEKGFKFLGEVPQKLRDALGKATFDVFRIKFTSQGHYFFADKDGNYTYYM